ncbi:hypothetical protein [Enorma massiliensis]|uniref:hypothetical protein n=1 Tax=Enorma massiliensis TaxID=1472761 RepID=UPI001EF53E9A|nr:hypothetical protein [Enorma massiliensis]
MVISHRTTLRKREIIGVPRPSHDRTQRMIESKDNGELNLVKQINACHHPKKTVELIAERKTAFLQVNTAGKCVEQERVLASMQWIKVCASTDIGIILVAYVRKADLASLKGFRQNALERFGLCLI